MLPFPSRLTLEQAASKQPGILAVMLLWFVPAQVPRLLTLMLSHLPFFAEWARGHPESYLSSFFVGQIMLMTLAFVYAFGFYGKALYSKTGRFWDWRPLCLLLVLPLLVLHMRDMSAFVDSFKRMAEVAGPGQLEEAVHQLHERVWGSMAYGSSWLGMMCFSFSTLIAPLWEEAVFSGFVANRIGAKWGWLAAWFATPLCFTLVHVPVMTEPSRLALLYAAGWTYVGIRLWSGNVFLAITAHTLVNLYVMGPKWLLAWLHFRHLASSAG